MLRPEQERERRWWRVAAETQVDRFNRALSALRRILRGLRRELLDITQREQDALRRADEFFQTLHDELPHLPHHPDNKPDPKEGRRR